MKSITQCKLIWCLPLLAICLVRCSKEKPLAPSNQDENYLVVKDNPSDPVDHSIYEFYKTTGIPFFYNDTVARRHVADSAGIPQYFNIVLSLGYSAFASNAVKIELPKNKQQIPVLLDLLQNQLIPKIPKQWFIPSLLLVDSFRQDFPRIDMTVEDGWNAIHGFDAVAVVNRDFNSMSAADKTSYVYSVLTGLTSKQLFLRQGAKLQKDFFSISREISSQLASDDIYNSYTVDFFFPDGAPLPEDLAFMHYVNTKVKFDIYEFIYRMAPREEDDLRMFVYAALTSTAMDFHDKYAGHPAIISKFDLIRQIIKEEGLQLPN